MIKQAYCLEYGAFRWHCDYSTIVVVSCRAIVPKKKHNVVESHHAVDRVLRHILRSEAVALVGTRLSIHLL